MSGPFVVRASAEFVPNLPQQPSTPFDVAGCSDVSRKRDSLTSAFEGGHR
jgi:hypothetical protein